MLPAVGLLRAQDHPSTPPATTAPANAGESNATFSTGVKVVNVLATVRDKKGQIVKNLTQNDFLLDEDGRPQAIKYFAQETNLPLSIGLLVDTSGSTRRVLPDEKSASYRFLQQVLREDRDLAFVIHFDFEVELLQDLTPSREKLQKALDELETASMGGRNRGQGQGQPQGGGGGYPGGGIGFPGGGRYPRRGGGYPGGGRYPGGGGGGGGRRMGGGTTLYDSVLLASDDVLKKQTGRKAIILLTDGEDNGSKVSLETAVEAAQRADVLVYSILFEDPDAMGAISFGGRGRMGNRPDGRQVLNRISRETGGRFFEVSKKQTISKVFEDIEEDLRNQYNLGYTPDRPETDRMYRHIHLSAKPKGLIVQTREGYYPT